MKKLLSLIAAVLFAGSMMAVTLDPGTQTAITPTNTSAGDPISLTINGIQIDYTGALGAANPTATPPVPADFRVFAGKTLKLTATSNISKVVIAGKANKKDFTATVDKGTVTTGASYTEITEKAELTDPLIVVENINATSVTLTVGKQLRAYMIEVTLGEGGEPVQPGDEPTVLQAVKDSTTWDFSKITANTENALYNKEGIQLTDESTPSKNDEVIYADYSEDFMTIGEDFNKAAIAFKGEYPIRKNQYCQAGTLHFKAEVAGTIVVKFSDTGSSASATAVKRYLVVNDEQTEYWTSRENNGETPYDAQLNVVSGKIAVPAGDVTITGSSAIVVHYVTFVPEKQDEPVLTDPTNCAEAAEAALSVSANNELYNNGAEYTIEGYVTSIQTAFNAQYSNISFWMADAADGGKVIQAYRAACASAEDAPAVGDKVAVTGKLTKYNSTPEFAAGCTYTIVEKSAPATNLGAKTIAEFLALKNTKDTCILTGVVANIVNNVYGNFDLCDEADTVYIYGLLTPDGQTKQFESLNVAEKDTLTVLAIYGEYNGKPQVSNAIFVEVKKAPAEDIEVTISSLTTPGALVWTDAVAAEGWWQIMGKNEFCDFSLSNISTTEAAGVYTVDDLDPEYSYISIYGETDTVDVAFTDGSVTVAIDAEGIVTINGTLVGSDGNNYIFNLTYKEPVAENTVEVQVSEANLIDDYAEYNLYGVYGYADDKTAYVQLGIWTEEGAGFEGQFTEDDLDFEYIGSAVIDATGSHNIFAAEITVTPGNNDGVYSITAKLLCYNNTLYVVTMQIGEIIDAIDHITNAVKASKLLRDGQLIIEKNGVRYNANGQRIK